MRVRHMEEGLASSSLPCPWVPSGGTSPTIDGGSRSKGSRAWATNRSAGDERAHLARSGREGGAGRAAESPLD